MSTMRPFFLRIIDLMTRLTVRNAPVRLVSSTDSKESSLIRSSSWSSVIPAFATSTSIGPCASSTAVIAASRLSPSVTSAATVRAPSGPPWPERLVTATRSPRRRNSSAIERPMPRLPPVIRTLRGSVLASVMRTPGWVVWLSWSRGVVGADGRCRSVRAAASRTPVLYDTWRESVGIRGGARPPTSPGRCYPMAYRFNPPPNWPIEDSNWSPPPGWQPDPSWGPAPEGWNFWVADDQPSADPAPEAQAPRSDTWRESVGIRGGARPPTSPGRCYPMAYRFNPPPNWPIEDSNWSPPPGWQPDPSWGPAPEGWNFWVADDQPSADPAPEAQAPAEQQAPAEEQVPAGDDDATRVASTGPRDDASDLPASQSEPEQAPAGRYGAM